MAAKASARFRYNAAIPIAGVVLLFGMLPLAASRWYLLPILVIPVGVIGWGWRAGVDVRGDTLAVRWLIGGRRLRTDQVQGFAVTRRRVRAALPGDTLVWLPAVRPTDVPRLVTATGLKLATRAEPPAEKVDTGPAAGESTEVTAAGDAEHAEPTHPEKTGS